MPPPEDWLSVAFGLAGVEVALELALAEGVEPAGVLELVVVVVELVVAEGLGVLREAKN